MRAERLAVFTDLLKDQRASLLKWSVALAAISAMYIGLYPSMGANADMQAMIAELPEAMITAFGYDQIGTPGGWMSSTVYGLIAPVLLLVYGIATGGRLIAGEEEAGTLELELTSPVSRSALLVQRLAVLWVGLTILVLVVAAVSVGLKMGLDLDVGMDRIAAGVVGLWLLVLGFASVAYAVGAATGRRGLALGIAAGLAVAAFVFNAIGPTIEAGWMTAVSPFAWYLDGRPLIDGFDIQGLVLLAIIPIVFALLAVVRFDRRDLMV
jgi:ABC-2 type transport system permease protein